MSDVFRKQVLRGELTSLSGSADEPTTAEGREYTRLFRVVRMLIRFFRYDLVPDGNIDPKAKELVEVVMCEYEKFSTCSGVGNYTRLSGATNLSVYAAILSTRPDIEIVPEGFADDASGIGGALFVDSRDGRRVLSFRGSETSQLKDWVPTDLFNAFGFGTAQYEQARDISLQFDLAYPTGMYAGHSLGGGLASHGAVRLGKVAYIYNSAGIKMAPGESDANIEHYYSVFDPVQFLQNFSGAFGGKAVGESHPLWWAGFHPIKPLCKRLGGEKCSYPTP